MMLKFSYCYTSGNTFFCDQNVRFALGWLFLNLIRLIFSWFRQFYFHIFTWKHVAYDWIFRVSWEAFNFFNISDVKNFFHSSEISVLNYMQQFRTTMKIFIQCSSIWWKLYKLILFSVSFFQFKQWQFLFFRSLNGWNLKPTE